MCTAVRRLFTLDEARASLPQLRELLATLRDLKCSFDRHRDAFDLLTSRVTSADGHLRGPIQHHRRAIEELIDLIRAQMTEVQTLGAEIKDLDIGLVDWPAERDGRTVYLCWREDEPDVAYWHDLDAGYVGRRPLE